MDRLIIIDLLNDLIQLDVDAVEAYSHAIKHVEYHDIKKRLLDYQDDHQNHIRNLTEMVQALDGKPIKPTPDLKGYLIEGFTMLRSLTGTKGALQAMFSNEKLTNKRYHEAAAQDLPDEIMKLIKTNLTHEIRHLGYLEDVLTIPRHEL